jgi:hypothetical protein
MGVYKRKKHRSENGGEGSPHNDNQTTLSDKPHISRSDANNYLIPILKEIGKAIFPAAAPVIELAYQVYKHYDAIKEGGSAVLRGDYKTAAEVAIKEGAKEALGTYISVNTAPAVDTGCELAQQAAQNLPTNEQGKAVAGKVAKGALKGAVEAVEDKIVDKIVDEVT